MESDSPRGHATFEPLIRASFSSATCDSPSLPRPAAEIMRIKAWGDY